MNEDYKSDIKTIAGFCTAAALWIVCNQLLLWIANTLMDHNHYWWAVPFVIGGVLMSVGGIAVCVYLCLQLWKGRRRGEL